MKNFMTDLVLFCIECVMKIVTGVYTNDSSKIFVWLTAAIAAFKPWIVSVGGCTGLKTPVIKHAL